MPTPGWKSTSTDVSSVVAGVPALARAFDYAIEKHDACAAAISSSGLVRLSGLSAREAHVMGNVPTPDEASSTVPLPSKSDPTQWAFAVRVVAMVRPFAAQAVCSVRDITLARDGRHRTRTVA